MAAIIIFVLFVVALGLLISAFVGKPSGRNRSVLWHDMNGEWRVRYPDGRFSQRFTRAVADDYRQIFGGEVVEAKAFEDEKMKKRPKAQPVFRFGQWEMDSGQLSRKRIPKRFPPVSLSTNGAT